jgi:signal transduction histidine kinase
MQGMPSTSISGRSRVDAVVETLAAVHIHGDNLEELAHDARNMVTALTLYCDLLEEPGVLSPAHRHYGSELRLVVEASRRLVEKLADLGAGERLNQPVAAGSALQGSLFGEGDGHNPDWPVAVLRAEPLSDGLVEDLREEILACRNLLAAIAGPSIQLTVEAAGGGQPIRMTSENLVRALVNLVKNAAEFISGTGSIRFCLADRGIGAGGAPSLVLTVEDSGCGIPEKLLETVFEPGFTTRRTIATDAQPSLRTGNRHGGRPNWNPGHRGLGLSITRSIVETAGGRIHAENRAQGGTRFVIELPVRRP